MNDKTNQFREQMRSAKKVMMNVLSPEMIDAVKLAKKHGGKLMRRPGGFWAEESWSFGCGRPWFGTSTIAALVKRQKGDYTLRATTGFPIEFTLRREPGSIEDSHV